jgi:septal ring factor EnvC (AmiA/AmiB activator)
MTIQHSQKCYQLQEDILRLEEERDFDYEFIEQASRDTDDEDEHLKQQVKEARKEIKKLNKKISRKEAELKELGERDDEDDEF